MCVPLNLSRCLGDGGGQFLDGAGLLRGTLRERLRAVRYLLRAAVDLLSGLVDLQNCGVQIFQKRRHEIAGAALEAVVLRDLNRIVAGVKNLRQLAERGQREALKTDAARGERERLSAALDRVRKLGQGAYEDYRERLLSREEYLRYRRDYAAQEETLAQQMERLDETKVAPDRLWAEELVRLGRLTELDRATLAETIREIRVLGGGRIEITYLFSKELCTLLEDGQTEP